MKSLSNSSTKQIVGLPEDEDSVDNAFDNELPAVPSFVSCAAFISMNGMSKSSQRTWIEFDFPEPDGPVSIKCGLITAWEFWNIIIILFISDIDFFWFSETWEFFI